MVMMTPPTIRLDLPMEQVNQILLTLGKRPFEEVAELIVEIRNQATPQVQEHQQRFQMQAAGRPANGVGHDGDALERSADN